MDNNTANNNPKETTGILLNTDGDNDSTKSHHHHHEHHQQPQHCLLSPSTNVETLQCLSRVPYLFRYDAATKPPEATALALDVFGRGVIIMSSIFLGPALLELAQDSVEEACQNQNESALVHACLLEGRVYGFRHSSVLSNIAIVSGLLGSIAMPVFGAFVDHTSWRWQVGAYSAVGLVLVKGIETMVSTSTWFLVAILQVVSSILYNMHVCTTLAYTSELTNDTNQQTRYNTDYTMIMYIANLVFLAWVTIVAGILGVGDVGTAKISQLTTSSIAAITFAIAWKYFFRTCPALNPTLPQNETLWTIGFTKAASTFQHVWQHEPKLKWLNLAVMFGEAATQTITSVGTTFMKSFMEMNTNEIAIVFLAVLIMGGPGSKLGGLVALRTDPITSAIICNTIYLASTTIAAIVFTSPQHKAFMPLLGAIWGLCMGWLFPMHSTAIINFVPAPEQTAEYMGIYILAGQLLSWMPPLLFTTLNEIGFKMSYGLASMGTFYFIAIGCLGMVHHVSSTSITTTRTTMAGPCSIFQKRLNHYDTPPEASSSLSSSGSASEYDALLELQQNNNNNTNTTSSSYQDSGTTTIQHRKPTGTGTGT